MTNNDYDALFDYYGRINDVDPRLGKTVFHLESGGNPRTPNSSQGAVGGMQMLPATAASLGVTNPRDMTQAIPAAMAYLGQGLRATGTPEGALAYYHGGPDTSQWGPKTAAYVSKGTSLYPQMTLASGGDHSAATPDADFNAKWGLAPGNAAPPSTADFNAKWGLAAPSNDDGAPKAATVPANPTPPAPAPSPAMGDPRVAGNALGGDQWIPPQIAPNPLSQVYQATTNALAPPAGYTNGNILPFSRNDTTGALSWGVPTPVRQLAQGAADLMFGPSLGTVTPQATAALTNLVPGLMTSPAARLGRPVGQVAANPLASPPSPESPPIAAPNPLVSQPLFPGTPASVAPPFMPPGSPVPVMSRIQQLIAADNQMAANKPAFIPPGASQPPNPLSSGPAIIPHAAPEASPNALAPAAPPENPLNAARPPTLGPVADQEAAEAAAIPEKLPPAPLLPPLTASAAGARADQLIKHFSAGKAPVENPEVVPGYVPKLSGLTNDPGIATLERGVQAVNPGPIGLRDQANQTAIRSFVGNLVQSPEDVIAQQAARDAATAPLRDKAFANAQPVDPTPIISQIDQILASPEGKRAAVTRTLGNVRDSLFNADDEPETDPAMLYGVRKNLNDLLDPVAQKDNPQLQQAARQLLDVKSNLDNVIEQGAPGFQDYVAKYAELSKPIDAQRYLQSLNLTNAADNVRLTSVDSAIKNIERQQNMPGVQKASAVSPDQLQALKTLRNTLRMDQFSSTAGKTLGSNTFQNLATNSMAGRVTGNPLVNVGLTGLGGLGGGPLGAMAAAGANMAVHGTLDRAESMVRAAIAQRLLNHQGSGVAALGGSP